MASRLSVARVSSAGLAALASAAAALLVYLPKLRNGFTSWGDDYYLLNTPGLGASDWQHARWMFGIYGGLWSPLTWLVFSALRGVNGMDPVVFHAAGWILHAVMAALVSLLAATVLAALGSRPGEAFPAALACGLVFAVHPLFSQMVCEAASLSDQASCVLGLASVLAWLDARRRPAGPGRRALLLASWGLQALSGTARWHSVCVPVAVVLLDRLLPAGPGGARRSPWAEIGPYFLIASGIVAVNLWAKRTVPSYQLGWNMAAKLAAPVHYLRKLALPLGLIPVYNPDLDHPADAWPWPVNLAILAGISVCAARLWRRRPGFGMAWLYYLLALGPTLIVGPRGIPFIHDHYAYHASLGFFLLLAGFLQSSWSAWARRGARLALGPFIALGFAIPVYAGLTVAQIRRWRDSETLMRYTLSVQPSSLFAQFRLGLVLLQEGRVREADQAFRLQLREHPAEGRRNLAVLHLLVGRRRLEEGRFDEAVSELRESLGWEPTREAEQLIREAYLRRGSTKRKA